MEKRLTSAHTMQIQILMAFDAFPKQDRSKKMFTGAEQTSLSEYINVSVCGGINIVALERSPTCGDRVR